MCWGHMVHIISPPHKAGPHQRKTWPGGLPILVTAHTFLYFGRESNTKNISDA